MPQWYTVTVRVESYPDYRVTVSADNEWRARSASMISYPYSLRGEYVAYDVRKIRCS
jgi:hypothetical protein